MTEPFVRPDVRQLLELLDNPPGPKSHEVGPEGARQIAHCLAYLKPWAERAR